MANDAQPPSQHDGLVVATLHAIHDLFVFAEIAQQIGATKFVVEGGTTQRAFGHDGQGRRHVCGLAKRAAPQLGHAETCQPRFGFGTAACGPLVPNFAACTCRGPRVGRNGGGVVVGFYFHQHMVGACAFVVTRHVARQCGGEALDLMALHDGRVVRISHHGVFGVELVGVADHAKQAVALDLAVNHKISVEDFVAAVLAVGLSEHHQFGVAGIAFELAKGLDQVIHFIVRQGQTPVGVGLRQGGATALQNVDKCEWLGMKRIKQSMGVLQRRPHRLGHAVMQQGL